MRMLGLFFIVALSSIGGCAIGMKSVKLPPNNRMLQVGFPDGSDKEDLWVCRRKPEPDITVDDKMTCVSFLKFMYEMGLLKQQLDGGTSDERIDL